MIKYGLISELDGKILEKTIDLICDEFVDTLIKVTEIGLFDCGTSQGIMDYIENKGRGCLLKGIDNEKDKIITNFPKDNADKCFLYIKGNSNEVYNQLEDNSQHLIFEDSCHCFAHVISTFFCYAPKVKAGGYFAFHDTGKHIKPFKDFQHGDRDNPDAYISVRKALQKIHLLPSRTTGYKIDMDAIEDKMSVDEILKIFKEQEIIYSKRDVKHEGLFPGWELIFDEADENDEAGGICVFKKLY